MLSELQIRDLATRHQTTEINIRREYLQHLFLTYLYRQDGSNQLFFKGGTALRICYQSPRFSEDLDFSSTLTETRQVEGLLTDALFALETEGLTTEITEAKATSGGYLARLHFTGNNSVADAIQVEISQRTTKVDGEPMTISSDLVLPYTIIALKRERLIAEKIQALLTRGKARDYYDLYFILRSRLLPQEERSVLAAVSQALDRTDVAFDKELKVFLPRSHWAIIDDFKSVLAREIERYL